MGTVNAACTGYRPNQEFRAGPPPAPKAIEGTPLFELWASRPARGPGAPVAVDDSAAYLGGSGRNVASVDLATGKTRWSVRLGAPVVAGVLRSDSVVLVATDQPGGKVYALKPESGSELWSRRTGYVGTPLAVLAEKIFVNTRKGELLALALKTGNVLWEKRVGVSRMAPAVVDSGTLVIATADSLLRIAADNGAVLARRGIPAPILGGWVLHGQRLIAGTGDSTVLALDPVSLQVLWEQKLDAPVLSAPWVTADTVWVATRIGTLYRLVGDSAPSAERVAALGWPVVVGPTRIGNWLLLGGADGELRALKPDGSVAWRVQVGRPVESVPVPLDDGFLGVGGGGHLHRYRL